MVNVLISTYNRPQKLKKLINNLRTEEVGDIIVFNDGSNVAYGEVDAIHFKYPYNNGKRGYYKLVNQLFQSRKKADYYIMIPDDAEIEKNFIKDSINRWKEIKDPKKICLNLLADSRTQCWTKFTRVQKGKFWLSQWNDCCFIAENKFFAHVGEIKVPHDRWKLNKMLGSGVGHFISSKLYSAGFNMYQVKKTLVGHGDHESVMNPEARKENPLKA